ncbi:Putative SWI/SNF and RSC complexes subunit Ssr4 protein [Septoria linicola]|uniref:SWI/SNF and RSC complexes subunit Ssr4 protein n=1 Tax=Septoria linicola TaxID=215465 RepID=A0A9Q9B2B8_9PEZI|nr:Putative SWI/SNF and RSC complexes subunit Ssr4 protein [Septoria linicola]
MQNPSQGVAPQLQPHVHLVSGHRFPHVATLGTEQAYRYLLDAPTIVKQISPMSWHYVTSPQDGTVWLEWIPQEKTEHPYPSDGYVWGDMEQSYRQDYNGYTLELRVQTVGYRPGHDQMATHARTRYHFIAKSPNVAAANPDPSLWIVHYHSADPKQIMPASQVPVSPHVQQIITQRRWLESQGRLERREFMLHDREHWPTLHIPGHERQQPNPVGTPQRPYQPYPSATGPPNKRPRTSGPSGALMPGASDSLPDMTIEAEEDTSLGDFFDHLTQRDISMARYMQHHRWMEEVFSSPYATSQIVPPDLGLGLMGELKGLTDGILEPPNTDVREDPAAKPAKAKEADAFSNLTKEQVDEFSKRVAKHLEEGQAEIEKMKADHAAKMAEWKKQRTPSRPQAA